MAGQDDGYGWDLKIRCVCELDSFLHYWKFIAFMAIKLGLILFTALYQAVVSLHHICIPNGAVHVFSSYTHFLLLPGN